MKDVNVKNKFVSMFAIIYILFEFVMFNIIFKFFIQNINNYEIRKKVICDIIIINRFFHFVYNFIEKIRRINIKIQKLAKKIKIE